MKNKFFNLLHGNISRERIEKETVELNRLEGSYAYSDFKTSTQYVVGLMKAAGLAQVRRYALPADSRTAHLDCVMPQAWDRTGRSRICIVGGSLPEKDRTIADTDLDHFAAGIWSAPTPKKGVTAEVVDFDALPKDEDLSRKLKGKWVLFSKYNPADCKRIVEAGAAGLLIAELRAADEYPDHVRWCNGLGVRGWYPTADDKRPVVFLITPRKAAFLRKLLSKGPVHAHGVMNTRIYDGEICTVSGCLPGVGKEEILMVAHMYEPFLADDAGGVVCAIEICRAIKELIDQGKMPPLQKTIRVVFSMELFGFAEYFENMARNRRTMYCINLDSICHCPPPDRKLPKIALRRNANCIPFFSDLLLRDILLEHSPMLTFIENPGSFSDDTFCSDPMIGIPSNWTLSYMDSKYHHNSGRQFMGFDPKIALENSAVIGSVVATLAACSPASFRKIGRHMLSMAEADYGKLIADVKAALKAGTISPRDAVGKIEYWGDVQEKRILSVNRFLPKGQELFVMSVPSLRQLRADAVSRIELPAVYDLSPVEQRATNMIVTRLQPGIPHSLAKIPVPERYEAPAACKALLFGFLDGKRTLLQALKCVEYETGEIVDPKTIKQVIEYLYCLEKYGYVTIKSAHTTTPEEIEKELRALGLARGDRVVVHVSLSSLGTFKGGPEAFCRLCMKIVGKTGTILIPTFNFYTHDKSGGVYDPAVTPSYTGAASEAFRKMKDVYRSLDPSHPVCAWGKDAAAYVRGHHKVPTMDVDSPLGLLEQNGGKIMLIGCPGANTFMHVVETSNNVRCLGQRMEEYKLKLPSGKIVPARTWAWRGGSCEIGRPAKVYELMRKDGTLIEKMFRDAHLMLMNMSDYRPVMEKLLADPAKGCSVCKIRPRRNEFTVKSDWDARNRCLKRSRAFTGEYEPEVKASSKGKPQ